MSRVKALMLFCVFVGVGLRLWPLTDLENQQIPMSWREADYFQIARGFDRESMNILTPRVDWRGNTSGEVEMEFPAIPWLAAALSSGGMPLMTSLRVLSAILSALTLAIFAVAAWQTLNSRAAVVATALFALSPRLLTIARSIQPEPLLLLTMVAAYWGLSRFVRSVGYDDLLLASLLVGFAVLAKGPAVHMVVLVVAIVSSREVTERLSLGRKVLAAVIMLLPPIVWYGWGRSVYAATGLSLGISNETHLVNLGVLQDWGIVFIGNVRAELREVFSFTGVLLLAGLFLLKRDELKLPLAWYACVLLFHAVASDTSGDDWASYYHSIGIPAGCLLMGLGADAGLRAGLLLNSSAGWPRMVPRATLLVLAVTLAGIVVRDVRILRQAGVPEETLRRYECAVRFAKIIPKDDLILVRGGGKRDRHGHPVAFNESTMFAWMDRRGFNYPSEDFLEDTLVAYHSRGARYWVSDQRDLVRPEVVAAMQDRAILVDTCAGLRLLELRPRHLSQGTLVGGD